MSMDLADRAYRSEVQAAQVSLRAALDRAEMSIKSIRDQMDHGGVLPGEGRRLMTDSADVLLYMATLATLTTCRPLIGRDDQD